MASNSPVLVHIPLSSAWSVGVRSASPTSQELDLLEACLWVIPDFLERAKDRSPDVLEYYFKGISGMMSLDLSWVRMERLEQPRPTPR